MNKLQGFYALEKSNLPAVPWKKYKQGTKLDKALLWTIRSAVKEGDDLHLPRKIGVTAFEAEEFANELYSQLEAADMIIYYPYFIAVKSGVLDISSHRIAIEAVKDDLWNLVTYNKTDVTIIFEEDDLKMIGDDKFLTREELLELIDYCTIIKKLYSSDIADGKNVILEWSFAYESDINKKPLGEAKLVFYEIRTV